MKNGILTLFIVVSTGIYAIAQPLIDREGIASFFSEAPMEDIEAINKKVLGAIDLEKGTLAVSMLINKFHFDKSLMEEHFNENYLESEKYPKATYKGVIKNIADLDFSKEGSFEAESEGELEIHGVAQPLSTWVKFEVTSSALKATTEFPISIADHDIDIPRLVIKNIAEVVEVKAAFNFKK